MQTRHFNILTLKALNFKMECSNFEFRPIHNDISGFSCKKYKNMTNSVAPDQRAPLGAL